MNYAAVRDYINFVRGTYYEKGFLAVDIEAEGKVSRNPVTGKLVDDLLLTVLEDRPFIISGVEIARNYDGYVLRDEKLSDGAVRSALGLTEGEVYDEAKLQKGLKKLNSICGHCEFVNRRQADKYGGSSGFSSGVNFDEDYENRTVRIIIYLYEPVVVSK